MTRNRLHYAALMMGVIVAGLASRWYSADLPRVVGTYAGDSVWALVVFLGLGLLWRTCPTWQIAVAALALVWLNEFSQLYHAAWADVVRSTTLGALVFGRGFVWSDLACYSVGVGIGAGAEYVAQRLRTRAHFPQSGRES